MNRYRGFIAPESLATSLVCYIQEPVTWPTALPPVEWPERVSLAENHNILTSHKTFYKFPVKVLAGIVLLSSARMAKYMTENVPGISAPQNLIDELAAHLKVRR